MFFPPFTPYSPNTTSFSILSLNGQETGCSAGDAGSISGLGRSPGEGHGNPLRYSCLRIPMDRGAWWATVPGVAKSQSEQLSTAHNLSRFYPFLQGIHYYHMEHIFFLTVHLCVKPSCPHNMYTCS